MHEFYYPRDFIRLPGIWDSKIDQDFDFWAENV